LALALMASHPNERHKHYATVAQRLVEVIERLEAQR
jgi:hypothetical protein